MASWEPLWELTVDCRGRNQTAPFSNPDGDNVRSCLGRWKPEFDSRDVKLTGLDSGTAAQCLAIPDHQKRPFVKSAVIDDSCLPSNSYFDPQWRTHREQFWSPTIVAVKENSRNTPPLLAYALWADHLVVGSLMMAGAQAQLIMRDHAELHLHSTASGPLQSVCDWLAKKLPSSVIWSSADAIAGHSFVDWHEPQFALEREPYYDYWQLRPIDQESTTEGCIDELAHRDPLRHWFEKATVRYSNGCEYRDFELTHLLAGALICLPGLTYWRLRFAKSNPILRSASALSTVVCILLAHGDPESTTAYDSLLPLMASIGIPATALRVQDAKIHILGQINSDALEAIRLLVPPSRLIAEFVLDGSGLDEATLA